MQVPCELDYRQKRIEVTSKEVPNWMAMAGNTPCLISTSKEDGQTRCRLRWWRKARARFAVVTQVSPSGCAWETLRVVSS